MLYALQQVYKHFPCHQKITRGWPKDPKQSLWVTRKNAFFSQPMKVTFSENGDFALVKRAMIGHRQSDKKRPFAS